MSDIKNTVSEEEVRSALKFSIGSKSIILAYVLWFFLGVLGVHRMYLGKMISGVIMAVLTVVGWFTLPFVVGMPILGVVFLWWVADAVLMFLAVRKQSDIIDNIGR